MASKLDELDLASLSFEELANLQKKTQESMKARKKDELKIAYQKFQDIAKSLGVTVNDIIKSSKGKTKRPPRYQNPEDKTQTWTGQGRKPKWLMDKLAVGKKLEDFAL